MLCQLLACFYLGVMATLIFKTLPGYKYVLAEDGSLMSNIFLCCNWRRVLWGIYLIIFLLWQTFSNGSQRVIEGYDDGFLFVFMNWTRIKLGDVHCDNPFWLRSSFGAVFLFSDSVLRNQRCVTYIFTYDSENIHAVNSNLTRTEWMEK